MLNFQMVFSVLKDTPWKINMEPETTPLEFRKIIFQTIISSFYGNLLGCNMNCIFPHNLLVFLQFLPFNLTISSLLKIPGFVEPYPKKTRLKKSWKLWPPRNCWLLSQCKLFKIPMAIQLMGKKKTANQLILQISSNFLRDFILVRWCRMVSINSINAGTQQNHGWKTRFLFGW